LVSKKAFFGKVPFPVIHIDTSYKFPEIYEFRDKTSKIPERAGRAQDKEKHT